MLHPPCQQRACPCGGVARVTSRVGAVTVGDHHVDRSGVYLRRRITGASLDHALGNTGGPRETDSDTAVAIFVCWDPWLASTSLKADHAPAANHNAGKRIQLQAKLSRRGFADALGVKTDGHAGSVGWWRALSWRDRECLRHQTSHFPNPACNCAHSNLNYSMYPFQTKSSKAAMTPPQLFCFADDRTQLPPVPKISSWICIA